MLIRQAKNTFIRCNSDYGYITNQLTKHDRTYDDYGADILNQISRQPQQIGAIVENLLKLYTDVDLKTLENDVQEMLFDLVNAKFLVSGQTIQELDDNDIDFAYSLDNPKTLAYDFTQTSKQDVIENTQDFFLERVQKHPTLSGLQFELTSRCNERCIHCYIPNAKKNSGNDMPLEKVKSIIDEFATMGGLHVTLSGGELFLHKNINEILLYCRQKDMMVSVLSNLVLLKNEHIEMLKQVNVSLVQVSLYSMNAEIHDKITTIKGSFDKTKAAIEKLVAANVPLQISCPVMKANAKGYDKVLQYAYSLKVKANTDFIMMAQADCDTANLANRISLDETEELLNDIIKFDDDYIEVTLKQEPISKSIEFDYDRFSKQPICGVGQDNCCITENGDVYPCAGWQGMVLGNVFKNSLQEIWSDSPKVKELRKITQANFPKCIKCEARNYCAMCLVRNYNESDGDMFKINEHFCKVAFLNKRIVEEHYKEVNK